MRYDRLTKDFRAVLSKAEATLRVYERKLKEHRLRDCKERAGHPSLPYGGRGCHEQAMVSVVDEDTACTVVQRCCGVDTAMGPSLSPVCPSLSPVFRYSQ